MFCFLHLSDLHRSREEPANNASLLAALLADQDRYLGETPTVPRPEGIIVSGDLIRGASIGQANWQDSIREQYNVASEFLNELVQRFLNGDKARLVLVPGNHDVCWNTAFSAMERVPDGSLPEDLKAALQEPSSPYRW